MKIYFAASIRGGQENHDVQQRLITELQRFGEVLTEHIFDEESKGVVRSDEDIFLRDMEWVHASDVVVAEVSTPSLGVGYELGQAQALGKKVICLYKKEAGKRLSAMISGNEYFTVFEYEHLDEVVVFLKSELN